MQSKEKEEHAGLQLDLRDHFAGQALAGFISALGQDFDPAEDIAFNDPDKERIEGEHQTAVAKWCYGYADAMIATRNTPPQP